MKTLRLIGMAFMSVFLCANFAACSSSDDDEPSENGGGEVTTSEKKIVKIACKAEDWSETRTFDYDDKGRLIQSIETDEENNKTYTYVYKYIWGDNAIKVSYDDGDSYTLTLKDGLVQSSYDGDIFTYNQSKKFIKGENEWETITAIWDGDKLMSISNEDEDAILTYSKSCKKGYFPFIPTMIDFGSEYLFVAHPEIAGMRTAQLPSSVTWDNEETSILTYEFDKEGYISKVVGKETYRDGYTETYTYTITWQ